MPAGSTNPELAQIRSGQLYLVRPDNMRASRECIYNDAMITIRRVPSHEHTFELVVTHVFEDGTKDLIDEDDESDLERCFLVDEALQFRPGSYDGELTFIWRDLQGDMDEQYEFVANGINQISHEFFENAMYKAMYERKYSSSEIPTEEELSHFAVRSPASHKVSVGQKSLSETSDAPISSENSQTAKATRTLSKDVKVVVSEDAELYIWDFEQNKFLFREQVSAKILQEVGSDFYIVAETADGVYLRHRLTPDLNARLSMNSQSFTWNHVSPSDESISWCFRYSDKPSYDRFSSSFRTSMWEVVNDIPWQKAKPDEQSYAKSSWSEDVEMKDANAEDDRDSDEEAEEVAEELEGSEHYDDDEEEEEVEQRAKFYGDKSPLSKGPRNSKLVMGYKDGTAFVTRGDRIGVFRSSGDDKIDYKGTVKTVDSKTGRSFTPSKAMLHQQDRNMILANPSNPHALYNMDIEHGKIVEEWKVHEDVPIEHIAPDSKFAPTTSAQTLVGASHNALFRIDPRISGNKMVDSQYKQYAGKNAFSDVVTTEKGGLAVASSKGDIRLFDTIGKNAKTALPPLGDPILGVDVTADGRWIVATCKTYLLLIDTLIGEGRFAGALGFDRSFPADAKPMPRRLTLQPQHVAYMGGKVSFTPARFNTGQGQEANAIVTSTGPFVIAWDFRKIKRGQLDKYEIKKYEDTVVQDNFQFGDDQEIVVALQDNVLAIKKSHLKRPGRASLGLAPSSSKSASSIVRSAY